MIKQVYLANNEIFTVIIDGSKVLYQDRKMPRPFQMIPLDKQKQREILMSRNKIDKRLLDQFKLTKEEQEEYNQAMKDEVNFEERLAEICKKDCLKEGGRLQKEERR